MNKKIWAIIIISILALVISLLINHRAMCFSRLLTPICVAIAFYYFLFLCKQIKQAFLFIGCIFLGSYMCSYKIAYGAFYLDTAIFSGLLMALLVDNLVFHYYKLNNKNFTSH